MKKYSPCLFIYDHDERYLDVLAPLSALLNIPLLVTESPTSHHIESFYPSVNCHIIPRDHICNETLKQHNVIISCHPTYQMNELFSVSSTIQKNNPLFIWFPSQQKEEYASYEHLDQEQIILVWGEALLQNLQTHGVSLSIFRTLMTGDIKHTYAQKMKKFYQNLLDKTLFSFLSKEHPSYLLAPVFYQNKEKKSLLKTVTDLIENAPSTINLIVKINPLDQIHEKKIIEKIKEKTKSLINVFSIIDYPVIPALFNIIEGMFTNNVSYAYHFCIYDKPLYFLDVPPPPLFSSITPFLCKKINCFPELPLEKKPYSIKKMIHSLNFDHSVTQSTLAKSLKKAYKDYSKDLDLI